MAKELKPKRIVKYHHNGKGKEYAEQRLSKFA